MRKQNRLAIFAPMLSRIGQFLNRPLVEDFSFRNQVWVSVQGGIYVFVFIYLFGNISGTPGYSALTLLLFFAGSVCLTTFTANFMIPQLLPTLYDEENWTVGKHTLHVLLVLFLVSAGNQAVLRLTQIDYLPFWRMYVLVTLIGFFPITAGVFMAEQRRLKRNLAQAQTLNAQLDKLHQPTSSSTQHDQSITPIPEPVLPKGITLIAENGRDKLSLLPNQLIYLESVGNYVEVHWLSMVFPQKTVLRATLKEMEAALGEHPQFFRCHRAFIINLRAINKTEGNARGYQLIVSGSGRQIPVSRGYVNAFDARMQGLV